MSDAPHPTTARGPGAALRVLGLLAVGFVVGRASVPFFAKLPLEPPAAAAQTPLSPETVLGDLPVGGKTSADKAADNAADSGIDSGDGSPGDAPLTGDELLYSQLVGRWTAESHGTQVCTLNVDGTGRNVADLDWMASLVYGSKLDMTISWTVRDGHLVQDLLGGEPADMIAKIAADFGRIKTYRVENMTAESAVLVDTADGEAVTWTRVE